MFAQSENRDWWAVTDVYQVPGESARSDAELILEVRGGDLEAYGALYERHAGAARSIARQYVRSSADADDVVAEAFHRVLDVLQHGGGPDATFRAYLLTVVRRLAADLAKGVQRTRPTADETVLEAALDIVSSTEAPALAGFERSVVRNAYEALPERWQAVLWYTEVEQRSPAEIAPILGLTPNGVSALAYRAREGLRVGYLQEHLTAAPSDGCRAVNPLLGSYVRGGLARREVSKVDEHVKDCAECRSLVLELADVAHGMRAVVAPLVVGAAGMAVLGALPLGGLLTGSGLAWLGGGTAGLAGSAGAGGSAAGAAGSAGTALGTAGTTGAAGTAGAAGSVGVAGSASAGAAGSVGVAGSAGVAGSTGAVGAGAAGAGAGAAGAGSGAAAAAGAAGAAGSAAAGSAGAAVAVASGTAVVSGAGVVAAAGAVAVATVGVVTVLTALNPAEPTVVEPPVIAASAAPWETLDDEKLDLEEIVSAEDADPADDPASPTNLAVAPPLALPTPASLEAVPTSAAALQPRVAQHVSVTVTNSGQQAAQGAYIEITLPAGMELASTPSPIGAGAPVPPSTAAPSAGPTVDTTSTGGTSSTTTTPDASSSSLPLGPASSALACGPTGESGRQVQCALGVIPAGESRSGYVAVMARSGGSYPITAEVWAEGLQRVALDLPPTTVLPYGAELTAGVTGGAVANPGATWVPVTVRNTGDSVAAGSWSVLVTVPDGLRPVAGDGDLACGPRSEGGAWSCSPRQGAAPLEAGESRSARIRVVADGDTAAGSATVGASPVLPGSTNVVGASGAVDVAAPWAGATSGAGTIAAVCSAKGGVGTARAVVEAAYTNQTAQPLTLRLDAAGESRTAEAVLSPGGSTTVRVPDGMRVPGGAATWTLSTTVAGETFRTTVPAGSFGGADCYDPSWDVTTSATTVNVDGKVVVRGKITNATSEPMQVGMSAAGSNADAVLLAAGSSTTLSVATGRHEVAAGDAVFSLYRWVADTDGDEPSQGVVPSVAPRAPFEAATIAPATSPAVAAGECRYDADAESSRRLYSVPLDNGGSTLPVTFVVRAGDRSETVTLAPGASTTVDIDVPWSAGTGTVTADGRRIATLEVGFDSCAGALVWPAEVEVEAAPRCEGGAASLVVDVANGGARSWHAELVRRGTVVGSQDVAASSSARIVVDEGSWRLRSGTATLRLTRTVEGTVRTVEQDVAYEGIRCVVRAPSATLDLGAVEMDRHGSYVTSWRTARVVLDNTGSTVPVKFHVEGPQGRDRHVTVPAGETSSLKARRVDGRLGHTWSVSARRWSTTLTVDRFTAAEAGWCGERVAWGEKYSVGDVRSWNGFAFTYVGRASDGEGHGADVAGRGGRGADSRNAAADRGGHSDHSDHSHGGWTGRWSHWEKIGLCEYA